MMNASGPTRRLKPASQPARASFDGLRMYAEVPPEAPPKPVGGLFEGRGLRALAEAPSTGPGCFRSPSESRSFCHGAVHGRMIHRPDEVALYDNN